MFRRLLMPATLALALAGGARAEAEPVLDAATLVGPELLSGPGWQVYPRVEVRGYQARFRIHTDWGELEADSVELLAVRVAEMPALAALHGAEVDEVVAAAAKERALHPANAVGAVAREPMRAVTGLPLGVARYFGERWQRLRAAVRRLADRGRDEVMHEGSPYDQPGSLMGAAGDDRPGRSRGFWKRRGREVAGLAKQEVGYPAARRALAARLGVDPSTRNPLIAPRLDALAWAETSGRFATARAIGLVGGPAVSALAYAVQVNQWVLQAPPEQLRQRNQERLGTVCLDDRLVRAFLRDGAYGPTLQTELVDLMLRLEPTAGCEALLETALMATDEPQARFVVNGLRLLVATLRAEERRGEFVPQGALLAYRTPAGELVVPLAVDWLAWTPELQRWFGLGVLADDAPRRLLVSGVVSELAQQEISARGWRLAPPPPYPGEPPYRRGLRLARSAP